jgi:hypothetical protein
MVGQLIALSFSVKEADCCIPAKLSATLTQGNKGEL